MVRKTSREHPPPDRMPGQAVGCPQQLSFSTILQGWMRLPDRCCGLSTRHQVGGRQVPASLAEIRILMPANGPPRQPCHMLEGVGTPSWQPQTVDVK